jgi:hypothetical protein
MTRASSEFLRRCACPALLLASALLLGLHWEWGAAYQYYAPWDYAMLLDGGWRVCQGQIPHVDFISPLGPLGYWLVAAGFQIGPPSIGSCLHGHTLAVAVLGVLAFALARPRLGNTAAAGFAFLVCLTGTGLNPLDQPADVLTSAMSYNRLGWALLLCLGLLLLTPHRRRGFACSPAELALVCAGLAAAFLLKFNFAFGILALAGCRFLVRPWPRFAGETAVILGGGLLFLAAAHAAGGFFLEAYLRQIASAGEAHTLMERVLFLFLKITASGGRMAACFVLALAWTGLSLAVSLNKPLPPEARLHLLLWVLIVAASYLTGSANMEVGALPLLPLASVVLLRGLGPLASGLPPARPRARTALAAALLLLSSWDAGKSLASYAYALNPAKPPGQLLLPGSARAAGAYFTDVPGTSEEGTLAPHDYIASIRDGIRLLRQYPVPDGGLAVITLTQPFDFLENRQPAPHLPVCWHLGHQFSPRSMPDLAALPTLRAILRPKQPIEKHEPEIWAHYEPWILEHFDKTAETPYWELWLGK